MIGFKGTFAENKNDKPSSVEIHGVTVERDKQYLLTPKKKTEGVDYPMLILVTDLVLSNAGAVDIHYKFRGSDGRISENDVESIPLALDDSGDDDIPLDIPDIPDF